MKVNGKEVEIVNKNAFFRGYHGVEVKTKDCSKLDGAQSLGVVHTSDGSYETYFIKKDKMNEDMNNTNYPSFSTKLANNKPNTLKDDDTIEIERIKKWAARVIANPVFRGTAIGGAAGLAAGIVNSLGVGYTDLANNLPNPIAFAAGLTAASASLGGVIAKLKQMLNKSSVKKESFEEKVKFEIMLVESYEFKPGQDVKFRLAKGPNHRSNHRFEGMKGKIIRKSFSNRPDRQDIYDVEFNNDGRVVQIDCKNLVRI